METIVWAKNGSSLIHKYRLVEYSTFKSIFSSSIPGTYLNQWLIITCRLGRVVTSFTKQLFVTQFGWFQYLSPLMPTCIFASAVNLFFVLCKKNKKSCMYVFYFSQIIAKVATNKRDNRVCTNLRNTDWKIVDFFQYVHL